MNAILYIRGVIGPELFDSDPGDMGNTLSALQAQYRDYENVSRVTVFIHSPGGSMDEGFAMHDWLRNLGVPITTIAEGSVYSIASVLFLSGDERLMSENSQLMIHNPRPGWLEHGDADYLESIAGELRRRENQLIDFYNRKTGEDKDKLREWMKNETFFDSQSAISEGFATGVHQALRAVAQYTRGVFNFKMADTKVLNQEQEQEAKGILDQIKGLLKIGAKNEAVAEAEPVAPEANTDELETLKNENAKLIGQVEALTQKVGELEGVSTEVVNLKATNQKLTEGLQEVQAKYEDLLKPAAEHKPAVAPSIENKNEQAASHFDGYAARMKARAGYN